MQITREIFDEQRLPRFGAANPERMQVPLWEWMIRGGAPSCQLQTEGSAAAEEGEVRRPYGPYALREFFKVPLNLEDGPVWTFDRMGATRTELPDGRSIRIGGEHEDWYDPDFHIYNDVVVFGPGDQIEIYGYPKEAFPPTDFHAATVVGNQILIVGNVGYPKDRRPGHTPVFSLNLRSYEISEVKTSGEMPGWISRHEAELVSGTLQVRGGEVFSYRGDEQHFRRNCEEYALDLNSLNWRRITNRNWAQFHVLQADRRPFALQNCYQIERLLPRYVQCDRVPAGEDAMRARLIVEQVPVSVKLGVFKIEIIVEGELAAGSRTKLLEEIRAKAEEAFQQTCIVELA